MKKDKKFSAFGIEYRTVQFSAAEGIELMTFDSDLHPCELLAKTEVKYDSIWHTLADKDNANRMIKDITNVLPPRVVLDGLLSIIRDFNFGFLKNWKSARIPARFIESSKTISSEYTEPLISQIIQDDVASMRELEEYYSLEDAFRMFDILMVKGINQAISNEASMKKSQRR